MTTKEAKRVEPNIPVVWHEVRCEWRHCDLAVWVHGQIRIYLLSSSFLVQSACMAPEKVVQLLCA